MTQYPHIILSWFILLCFLCRPSLGNSDNNTVKCLDRERKALLQFKDGITLDSCGLLTSWRVDTDCCQWSGVHCNNNTGHVIMLSLQGSDYSDGFHACLKGNLNSSLVELTYLRHLNLNFNDFSQQIPDFLGSLANLEYLSLDHVFFSDRETSPHGQSLRWLSRLRLLRYLDLSGTDFSAVKNWTQIISQLPFLGVLRMDNCDLPVNISSSVTYINSSSHLRIISLSGIGFNDSSIFQWLFNLPEINTQLVHLDLSSNSLAGPIPTGLGNLQHLSHLDLSKNHFEGPIPAEFRSLHSLSYFSLSQNNLQGSVFKIFTRLCNLQQLYLDVNSFTDDLTDVIRALLSCENTKLLTLGLSHNRFWGSIPDTIDSFPLLRELYLKDNQLSGKITPAIGQLAMLEKLDISSNSFNATLTHTHFLHLSRLRELYLSRNPRIVMNFDASWKPPFQLDIISLRSCKLGPQFPNWLRMQTNFSSLDVSNAGISDNIPISFWKSLSSNLVNLNMSHNQFYGSIPNLPQAIELSLGEVDLSSNLFEGVVPSWFASASVLYLNNNRFSDCSYIFCPKTRSYLFVADLSNNLLTGELPDCWMNINHLFSLHLENNRLSGNIPKSIGTVRTLWYLHLNNNSFSGPIPTSLENCTSLTILNLGYNSFTGNLPPWIGNFQHLSALILRKNHFTGEISANLCQLLDLQILDFGMNHITGVIPRCISKFEAMTGNAIPGLGLGYYTIAQGGEDVIQEDETATVMWKGEEQLFKRTVGFVISIDFSFNELSGEIPDGIINLTGLLSLDLSNNNLSGSISSEIGQLTALELLDLSGNHLIGEIPASLSNLSSLAILDLSNNNLSGKIPVGTQLQSFNASSYMGNPELCGAPLSKCPRDQTPVYTFNGDNTSVQDEHDDNGVFPGLYISVVLGLIIGFWGVFGTLVIKNSWRYAWFRLLDNIRDRAFLHH